MCGRFTYLTGDELESVAQAIREFCDPALQDADARARRADSDPHQLPLLNRGVMRTFARPRSRVEALVVGPQGFEARAFVWGFRPTRSTDVVFNTRIESALDGTPLWVGPVREGRCILPVASFFEPHRSQQTVSPRTGRQMKRQYEFADPDGKPLLLASVHDGSSLSILTTPPNAAVRPIHARMPLVLRFEEIPVWLFGDFGQLADRSAIALDVAPEDPGPSADNDQLSLF